MQCTAKSKRTGNRCKRGATPGLDKCYIHAGISRASQQVIRATTTYGLPRDVTPAVALLEEVRYAAGHVEWLRGKVAELKPEALTWGISERTEKHATEHAGTDITERAALNTWLEAYHRERRYLLDVAKAALAAGVEERLVQLAEAQGVAVVSVLARVFDRLQLTEAQRQLAAIAVPEELRAQSGM